MNQDSIEVSVQDVKAQMDQTGESDSWLLLDCREQQEYDTAQIEGSLLIPMNEVPNRVSEIESYRDKPIVVFCHGGVRSLKVTQWLRQNGFPQSQSMAGGIDSWSKQIDPNVPVY